MVPSAPQPIVFIRTSDPIKGHAAPDVRKAGKGSLRWDKLNNITQKLLRIAQGPGDRRPCAPARTVATRCTAAVDARRVEPSSTKSAVAHRESGLLRLLRQL